MSYASDGLRSDSSFVLFISQVLGVEYSYGQISADRTKPKASCSTERLVATPCNNCPDGVGPRDGSFHHRSLSESNMSSHTVRKGESAFLESRLLCHGTKGLIALNSLLTHSRYLPTASNCNQSLSQTAIKVPANISTFAISWRKFFESSLVGELRYPAQKSSCSESR